MQENKDNLFDQLLGEYIGQTISPQNQERLFAMVLESETYKIRYEEAVRLNTMLHLPYFESNKEPDHLAFINRIQTKDKKAKVVGYRLFARIAAAAIVLAAVSLGSVLLYKAIEENESYSLIEASTPLGGQSRILLPDGSVAWINARSELKYSTGFGKTDRQLYLEGEGYFEVQKNDKLPFSVCSGEMEVIATGTIFNVRSYMDDNRWEVNLLEGGVDILVADQHYSLHADERVVYDKTSGSVKVEPAEAHQASLWIKGKLTFYQASIPDIYKMLERHFNVRIDIASDELKEEYFFGSINLEMNLSEILNYLDVNRKYKVEVKNDVIIVRNK